MREILLSMALLSTVASKEFEIENHRLLLPQDEPKFWLARNSRIPWGIEDKEGRRHQETKSSVSRTSGSQSHDLNRFLLNNPNLFTNTPEDSQAPNNHQSGNKPSGTNKNLRTVLLPFDQSRLSKINPTQERLKYTWDRCRKTQGWRLQEPLYVEEPNWLQIESESLEAPEVKSGEPFFVTRGKRSPKLKITNPLKNTIEKYDSHSSLEGDQAKKEKTETQKSDNSKGNIQELEKRKKREISLKNFPKVLKVKLVQKRSETGNQNWLENLEKTLTGGNSNVLMTKASNYLQPRNKHSDILEILEEPFFISRGKKSNIAPVHEFSLDDFYFDQDLKHLLLDMDEDLILSGLEFDTKNKILENVFNNDARRKRVEDKNKNEIQANAKRGILDELDLQLDPFYVARG